MCVCVSIILTTFGSLGTNRTNSCDNISNDVGLCSKSFTRHLGEGGEGEREGGREGGQKMEGERERGKEEGVRGRKGKFKKWREGGRRGIKQKTYACQKISPSGDHLATKLIRLISMTSSKAGCAYHWHLPMM